MSNEYALEVLRNMLTVEGMLTKDEEAAVLIAVSEMTRARIPFGLPVAVRRRIYTWRNS